MNLRTQILYYLEEHTEATIGEMAKALRKTASYVQFELTRLSHENKVRQTDENVGLKKTYELVPEKFSFTSIYDLGGTPDNIRSLVSEVRSSYKQTPEVSPPLTEAGNMIWALKELWEEYYAVQEQTKAV